MQVWDAQRTKLQQSTVDVQTHKNRIQYQQPEHHHGESGYIALVALHQLKLDKRKQWPLHFTVVYNVR